MRGVIIWCLRGLTTWTLRGLLTWSLREFITLCLRDLITWTLRNLITWTSRNLPTWHLRDQTTWHNWKRQKKTHRLRKSSSSTFVLSSLFSLLSHLHLLRSLLGGLSLMFRNIFIYYRKYKIYTRASLSHFFQRCCVYKVCKCTKVFFLVWQHLNRLGLVRSLEENSSSLYFVTFTGLGIFLHFPLHDHHESARRRTTCRRSPCTSASPGAVSPSVSGPSHHLGYMQI